MSGSILIGMTFRFCIISGRKNACLSTSFVVFEGKDILPFFFLFFYFVYVNVNIPLVRLFFFRLGFVVAVRS